MNKSKIAYFVSDRTGLTVEAYGRSLLAQFPDIKFEHKLFPFVDNVEKAKRIAEEIDREATQRETLPIVFSTLVEQEEQHLIASTDACVIDLFSAFIDPLEECLGAQSAHKLGIYERAVNTQGYQRRLDAVDFALAHDDGVRPDQYDDADVILVGVSRCGKTPTSLYMAMNFNLKAANYPLTDDELDSDRLPTLLKPLRHKLVGLTINPRQLSNIREQRRPGSSYAALSICQKEIRAAEEIFSNENLPVFETTDTSIEEVASAIMKKTGLLKN